MKFYEFQAVIARTYGERDQARGIPATVAWLCEELGELAQAVRKGTEAEQTPELGDVFAWLPVSLATASSGSRWGRYHPLRRRPARSCAASPCALTLKPTRPAPCRPLIGCAISARGY